MPTSLAFSDAGGGNTIATSFASLSPLIDQVFFIGDGLTGDGSGSVQQFIVPTGATALYLGITDAPGYNGSPRRLRRQRGHVQREHLQPRHARAPLARAGGPGSRVGPRLVQARRAA